jgi:hypothetical protein
MGSTVSFHNFTQLIHFELKGCLLKSLLHLATAEPACSIPTQHMSINQMLSESHKMEGTVLDEICLDLKGFGSLSPVL